MGSYFLSVRQWSDIYGVQRFALKELRMREQKFLILLWSNGPVEGKINKLMSIKHSMYGRSAFPHFV